MSKMALDFRFRGSDGIVWQFIHASVVVANPLALSQSKGRLFVVRQAHHERTYKTGIDNQNTLKVPAGHIAIIRPWATIKVFKARERMAESGD